MSHKKTSLLIGATVACGLLTGCLPKINSFKVTPLGYCKTTKTIHVAWDTSHGDTTLQIQPLFQIPMTVGDAGSFELEPQDMTLTLTVNNGERHPHNIQIVRSVLGHALAGFASKCEKESENASWVTTDPAQFGGGPSAFDPNAHPSVISNVCPMGADAHATCKRPVQVIHNGVTWTIAPNKDLDVSAANAAMTGDWILRGQLLDGEVCGTESAAAAKELDLNVVIGCTGGAQ